MKPIKIKDMGRMYTIKETAKIIGIAEQSLRNNMSGGARPVPDYYRHGSTVRFSEKAIEEFFHRNLVHG